jgi:hypothetical protein
VREDVEHREYCGPGGPGPIKPGSNPTLVAGLRIISGTSGHRYSATYNAGSKGDSHRPEVGRGGRRYYESQLAGLLHHSQANRSESPCISSARVAVPKRLNA